MKQMSSLESHGRDKLGRKCIVRCTHVQNNTRKANLLGAKVALRVTCTCHPYNHAVLEIKECISKENNDCNYERHENSNMNTGTQRRQSFKTIQLPRLIPMKFTHIIKRLQVASLKKNNPLTCTWIEK